MNFYVFFLFWKGHSQILEVNVIDFPCFEISAVLLQAPPFIKRQTWKSQN